MSLSRRAASHRPRPSLRRLPLLLAAMAAGPAAGQTSRNVTLLAHVDTFAQYSSCASYVHSDGREYAVIGTTTGTAIYNIEVPSSPVQVAFIPGVTSVWREMKQYGDHLYVVTEGAGGGLQIVRMTDPDNPVLSATWSATFTTAHTVTVDPDRGLLFANGANGTNGGLRILSLAAPEAPVEVGAWYGRYAHDSHARGTRLFVAAIYDGLEVVLDVGDPANPVEIASWTTPGAFTHNSWTSADGSHLFTTDENTTGFVTAYDISALPAVTEVARYTANPEAIAHNVHVKGNVAYVAHYTEGIRLLDVSDPATPVEFGHYDTWPGASGGFNGNWAVDPFFPSGVFIVSDISSGLYVFRAKPDYGLMKGTVTGAGSGLPEAGVRVTVSAGGAEYLTFTTGRYALALDPGVHEIEATRFGAYPAVTNGTVAAGQITLRDLLLTEIPRGAAAGTIRGGIALTPLSGAEVHLHETPLKTETAAGGGYLIDGVPEGTHLLEAARAGYLNAAQTIRVSGGATTTTDLELVAMDFYDDVEAASGWALSAPGDNATAGRWIRADPVGSGPQGPAVHPLRAATGDPEPLHHPDGEGGGGPLTIQPEDDHTPDPGTHCFITGNGPAGGGVHLADVDGGVTTLVSPAFDLTGIADPRIAFHYWYTNDGGASPGIDPFVIAISNDDGLTWTTVDSIRASNHAWTAHDFRVADYLPPTAFVRMRFAAMDIGEGSIVEAGVDDFGYYATPAVSGVPGGAPPPPRPVLAAGPNPFVVAVDLDVHRAAPGRLTVDVYDAAGRRVRRIADGPAESDWTFRWDGTDDAGRPVPGGVYFIRAAGDGVRHTARVVRLR